MYRPRVIPCLLLKGQGLIKTRKFRNPTYLGDPVNIVRIFNDKEVDELILLDVGATVEGKKPPFELLSKTVDECFMPIGYGGGIRDISDVKRILNLGVEKVSINSYAVENPTFVRSVADLFGSQSVIVSIDVKKDFTGRYHVCTHGGRRRTGLDPAKFAVKMEAMGAGELFLTCIDRDGTMEGYSIDLIKSVANAVSIPLVACGGAGNVNDLAAAVMTGGASAAAAGSMFVFQGRHRAVLISYPSAHELEQVFKLAAHGE